MPGQPRPHRHCVARMLDAGLQPPRAIVCQRKCPMALHHELVARTHLQRQSTEFARFAGELVVRVLPGEPTQRYEHVLCEFMREAQARAGLVMPHLPHSDMAKDGMRRDTVSPRSRRRNAFVGSHAGATPSSRAATQALCPRPGKPAPGRSAPRCEGRYGPPALEPRRPIRRTACSRPTSVAGHHATIRSVSAGRRCDGTSPPRHDGHPISSPVRAMSPPSGRHATLQPQAVTRRAHRLARTVQESSAARRQKLIATAIVGCSGTPIPAATRRRSHPVRGC